MRSDDRGLRGRAPRGGRTGTRTHEGHTPPGLGVIGGTAPGWTSAILKPTVMVGVCHGWCFSCLIDKNLSRMGMGSRNKSRQEFYGPWRLMEVALNDFWTPRSTGKSHNLKERIRG